MNAGPDASSITDIYFDDGALLGIAEIDDSDPGVDFGFGATPAHLPGGRTLPVRFDATAAFSTSSGPPSQPNGVNPGESVGITFDLISGMDFSDVLAFLDNGGLRIVLKVAGFADGGSESFVNENSILSRNYFGSARQSGARKLRRDHSNLCFMRDLRKAAVST